MPNIARAFLLRWNITDLLNQGRATWPPYSYKCWKDPYNQGDWSWVVDDDNLCVDPTPWADIELPDLYYRGQNSEPAAIDYYVDRSTLVVDANHGWPDIIWEDEYPLEIQCQPCFTRFFLDKYESKWGPEWE